LGGLRGIAAVWVFALHAFTWNFPDFLTGHGIAGRLLRRGYLAVDLFFVLSGFLLFTLYRANFRTTLERRPFMEFMSRRLARIWPTLLISSTICLTLAWPVSRTGALKAYGVDVLFLSSVPGLVGLNGPAWSISAEILCYLLLPFAIRATGTTSKTFWAIGMVGLVALLLLLCRNGTVDNHTFLRAAPGFCGGILVSRMTAPNPTSLGALALVVLFGAVLFCPVQWLADVLALLSFLILVPVVARGFGSSLLESAPLRWLGDASYSFYLFHPFMFTVAGGLLFRCGIHQPVWWVLAVGLLTFALAILSYRFVETPLRRHWRGYYRLLTCGFP